MALNRFTISVAATMLIAGSTVGAQGKTLSFVTGDSGGSWYGIGAGLAEVFQKGGVKVSVEIGGGISNVVAVARGDSEIGMTNGFVVPMAKVGEPPFKEKISGVMGLAVFSVSVVQVPVLADSGIKSYQELKGQKYCLLPLSASSTIAFQKVLAAFGMSEDDTKFSRGNLGYCVQQMKDRKVIGTAAATAMPVGSYSELAASLPIRFLPIDAATFERVKANNPAFVPVTMPAGVYKGVEANVPTVGTQALLIGGKALSDDDAYKIVKSMAANLAQTRAVHSDMKGITAESMAAVAGLEMHPGAARYYREIGVLK